MTLTLMFAKCKYGLLKNSKKFQSDRLANVKYILKGKLKSNWA